MVSICVLKSVSIVASPSQSKYQRMKSSDLSSATIVGSNNNNLHSVPYFVISRQSITIKLQSTLKILTVTKTLPRFLLYHFVTHKSMFWSQVNFKSTWDKTLMFNILWKIPHHYCTAYCDEAHTYETAHKITAFEELQWTQHHRVRWNCDNQNVPCCFWGLEQSFLRGPLSRIKSSVPSNQLSTHEIRALV